MVKHHLEEVSEIIEIEHQGIFVKVSSSDVRVTYRVVR
jgi:hypothetical protein